MDIVSHRFDNSELRSFTRHSDISFTELIPASSFQPFEDLLHIRLAILTVDLGCSKLLTLLMSTITL